MEKTYNFRLEDYDRKVADELRGEYRDVRNGIVVVDPTFDFECYKNYIDLLNLKKDKWRNNGYLDLGMMPIAMAPSFMQQYIADMMLMLMAKHKVPCHVMPPVSLLGDKCNLPQDDIWVFKEDLAKAFGMNKDRLTLSKFIEEVCNDIIRV